MSSGLRLGSLYIDIIFTFPISRIVSDLHVACLHNNNNNNDAEMSQESPDTF